MSQSLKTTQRHGARLALALIAGGLVAGCSGNEPWTIDPDGYDGLGEITFPLLTLPCVISGNTMTLTVKGGEVAYLSLRTANNTVVASGVTGSGAECAVL